MIVWVISADYGLNGHEVLSVSLLEPTPSQIKHWEDVVTMPNPPTGYSGIQSDEFEVECT